MLRAIRFGPYFNSGLTIQSTSLHIRFGPYFNSGLTTQSISLHMARNIMLYLLYYSESIDSEHCPKAITTEHNEKN